MSNLRETSILHVPARTYIHMCIIYPAQDKLNSKINYKEITVFNKFNQKMEIERKLGETRGNKENQRKGKGTRVPEKE